MENGQIKRGRGRPKGPALPEQNELNGFFRNEIDEIKNLAGEGSEITSIDVSDKQTEKIARGYFVGQHAVGRRKDVRKVLEDRVIGKIGKSGKLLTDKLFELIEGVSMIDKMRSVHGKEEIRYYKVPPNLNAIIYALDRVLGKPKQLSVQATFSLSDLLKNNGDRGETIRPTDITEME